VCENKREGSEKKKKNGPSMVMKKSKITAANRPDFVGEGGSKRKGGNPQDKAKKKRSRQRHA